MTFYQPTDEQGNVAKDNEGNTFQMETITKTFDENTCNEVIKVKGASVGVWVGTGKLCVRGSDTINGATKTWDDAGKWMFDNQPSQAQGIYLSFLDNSGYETRVQFKMLAGPNYPIPGFPSAVKTEQILPFVQALIKTLKAEGIKDVKIIYPEKTN